MVSGVSEEVYGPVRTGAVAAFGRVGRLLPGVILLILGSRLVPGRRQGPHGRRVRTRHEQTLQVGTGHRQLGARPVSGQGRRRGI